MNTEQRLKELDKLSKESTERYEKDIKEFLDRIAFEAWEMGVHIDQVTIKDNYGEVFNTSIYGDKYLIKAPKLGKYETEVMTIEVKNE